ncbi:MAG: hypothetical protein U0Q16_02780 [Bryobacteraceae bacterium]
MSNSSPPEIHNRFDRIMKAFADEAPRLFMHLMGVEALDAEIEVVPLRPETAPAAKFPDHAAVVEVHSGGRRYIFHVEFQLEYKEDLPGRLARYGGSLAWQHMEEVVTVLILLQPDRVPEFIPEIGEYSIGRTRTEHPFRTVRMWKVKPGLIVDSNDPRLFPWAVLMDSTDEEVRKMGEMLGREGDEESFWRFIALGSLRYDRTWLEATLGGLRVGLVEAILEGSSLVKDITRRAVSEAGALEREQGRAEGRAEGKHDGRIEGARHVLRTGLHQKFPDLEDLPEIDQIESAETLESLLFGHVMIAGAERDSVERAIRTAAQRSA